MGDGFTSGAPPIAPASAELRGLAAVTHRLIHTRNGRLTIAISLSATALTGAVLWHFFIRTILDSLDAVAWFTAATSLLILPILSLALDSTDNMGRGPRLVLPLSTLLVLSLVATFTLFDRTYGLYILATPEGAPRFAPIFAVFAMTAAAYIPRVWSAARFAAFKQREIESREMDAAHKRQIGDAAAQSQAAELSKRAQEQDDAEALGAFLATLVVVGICALAWFAGSFRNGIGLQNGVGVGIATGVMGVFAIVIFLDWIAEAAPIRAASRAVRGFSRKVSGIASFYNIVDTVLVRIGAHAAGMEHREIGSRYFILGGTMLAMAVLAWNLPAPFGLVPAATGLLLALSVSRLWSWVEDDRNLASITRYNPDAPVKVGFREDFRDETLLGFLFVLVIVPIAMMQADKGLFDSSLLTSANPADKQKLDLWVGYYGFELAKALPVIDWADIYKLQPGEDLLKPNGTMGLHAVFAARLAVDLVLIASLLQAIAIATRNRQQKVLFAAGHINRLDELVEKEELKRTISRPPAERFKGNVDFRRYDRERLKEIYFSSTSHRERNFIETIFTQSGDTLDSAINVLTRIAGSHGSEDELYRTLDAVRSEHHAGPNKASIGDLVEVMTALRARSGLKDFKFALIKFASEIGSPYEVAEMLDLVMFGSGRDAFQYTRIEAAKALTTVAPKLPVCSQVLELMRALDREGRPAFGSAQFVPAALAKALRNRADELGCNPDAPLADQNKP